MNRKRPKEITTCSWFPASYMASLYQQGCPAVSQGHSLTHTLVTTTVISLSLVSWFFRFSGFFLSAFSIFLNPLQNLPPESGGQQDVKSTKTGFHPCLHRYLIMWHLAGDMLLQRKGFHLWSFHRRVRLRTPGDRLWFLSFYFHLCELPWWT